MGNPGRSAATAAAADPPAAPHLQLERQGELTTLRLSGRWIIEDAQVLELLLGRATVSIMARQTSARGAGVVLDTRGLTQVDLTGAALIETAARRLAASGVPVRWEGEAPEQLELVRRTLAREQAPDATEPFQLDLVEPVRTIGRWVVERTRALLEALAMLGHLFAVFGRALTGIRRLRVHALVRHVHETGIQAIPIVSLIAFLISVIVAYMGAQQLRRFGAEIFVVDLVTVGVLREMAVLLTAIIVAGRSGSAFAAEIGVMKLNEEVDALRAIGTDPVEVLVLPRVLGLVIALPLLTIVADTVGLTGGGLLCYWLLDISPSQYVARVQEAIAPTTFWVGLIKAPVFAFLIAFVGTLRGMQVRDSSRELGRLTTEAVVESIFLVILADALFAVIFMELDL
jgi:phospholipid/cholesterol/gamma-HCH transport system permease protein